MTLTEKMHAAAAEHAAQRAEDLAAVAAVVRIATRATKDGRELSGHVSINSIAAYMIAAVRDGYRLARTVDGLSITGQWGTYSLFA
jgi:hypothetical protein